MGRSRVMRIDEDLARELERIMLAHNVSSSEASRLYQVRRGKRERMGGWEDEFYF